jgi:hypothetical protein
MKGVVIIPNGRLGNHIIEYMFALYLQSYDENIKIYCENNDFLSIFNIKLQPTPQLLQNEKNTIIIKNSLINLNEIIQNIKSIDNIKIVIGYNYFNEDFMSLLPVYKTLFSSNIETEIYDDTYIIIHIRLEDIAIRCNQTHPNYPIIPFSFHKFIINKTKLKPVFIGQIDEGYISQQLKIQFPEAKFIEGNSILHDFEFMRRAKNLIISVSTFSYLA